MGCADAEGEASGRGGVAGVVVCGVGGVGLVEVTLLEWYQNCRENC